MRSAWTRLPSHISFVLVACLFCAVRAHGQIPNSSYVETDLSRATTCTSTFNRSAPQAPRQREFAVSNPAPIHTPIVWSQFRGERQLFGYNPAFTANRVSFATNGRPIIRDHALNLQVLLDNGNWQRISLFEAAKESLKRQGFINSDSDWAPKYRSMQLFDSGVNAEERVVFDDNCNAYTVINSIPSSLGRSFLMHSADGGHSWAVYPIPRTDAQNPNPAPGFYIPLLTVKLESPGYGGTLHATPALIISNYYEPDVRNSDPTRDKAWLVVPQKNADGSLSFDPAVEISDPTHPTLCCGTDGGFESQAVSYQDHIHVAYPVKQAMADATTDGHLGTPNYVLTYSRSQKGFIKDANGTTKAPFLLGVGLSGPHNQEWTAETQVPDPHSQTALALDAQGCVHAVVAGHDSRMIYRKSCTPETDASWSAPDEFTLKHTGSTDYPDEYTYPSLVIDSLGQPNVVSRWSGSGYVFRLVYQVRSAAGWEPQRILLDPGRSFYGIWYHQLSIDPWNRLFVSYSYYPDNLFSDEAQTFANQYGFQMSIAPPQQGQPQCVPTTSADPSPHYCQYVGYESVSPSILITRAYHEAFDLAITDTFFQF